MVAGAPGGARTRAHTHGRPHRGQRVAASSRCPGESITASVLRLRDHPRPLAGSLLLADRPEFFGANPLFRTRLGCCSLQFSYQSCSKNTPNPQVSVLFICLRRGGGLAVETERFFFQGNMFLGMNRALNSRVFFFVYLFIYFFNFTLQYCIGFAIH